MGTSNNEDYSRLGSILGDLHFVKLTYTYFGYYDREAVDQSIAVEEADILLKRKSLNVGGDSINIRILILETY